MIPLREVDGVHVMDTPAILRRHPELPGGWIGFDNPAGSAHASRWEDVNELLDAGISVITSVNIQYIDDLRERVQQITGKSVTQTVPRSFLNSTDEIVVVDAPPEMCVPRDGQMAGGIGRPGTKALRTPGDRAAAGRRCSRPAVGSLPPAQRHAANLRREALWFASRREPTRRP